MKILWSFLFGLLAIGKAEEIRTSDYKLTLENGTLYSVRMLRDVDELNLSNLGIRRMEDQVFENVKRAKILNLQSNNIDELGSGTFSRLGEILDELNLGSNKIYHIESPFLGLVNLKLLNFSDNPAEYLDPGAFFGIPKTADILVQKNQLQGFYANLFENTASRQIRRRRSVEDHTALRESPVEETELDDTVLTVIIEHSVLQKAAFSQKDENHSTNSSQSLYESWRVLDLAAREIESVAEGWYQFSKTQFFAIFLSGNDLTDISPELLNDLPESVKRVDLSDNSIREIKNDVIKNVDIRVLDLMRNRIKTIEDRAFESLRSLSSLWLTDNRIREISFAASLPINLTELYLNENKIIQIPDGAFSRLSNLKKLHLEDNQILVIHSGAFEGLRSLIFLDLSDNQITEIESNSFVGVPKNYLWLNGNRISKISPASFNIENLVNLYLQNNLITDMNEETFGGLPGLRNLWMEGNRISEIAPGTMKHLNALSILDISKNPLTKLRNGALFGLPKTGAACEVFVNDNKFEIIQGGVFDDF